MDGVGAGTVDDAWQNVAGSVVILDTKTGRGRGDDAIMGCATSQLCRGKNQSFVLRIVVNVSAVVVVGGG